MPKKVPEVSANDARTDELALPPEFPPAEEELGGGDICSLQEQPSTDDDKPLD